MMAIRMTGPAEDHLREYLDRVRRSLGAEVEASEVEAGIREHIDAELARRSFDEHDRPATREDVAEVIERLGPPESWEAGSGASHAADTSVVSASQSVLLTGFGLVAVGAALAFTPRWGVFGWLLIVAGSLVLRLAVPMPLPAGAAALERLADAWWRGFAVAAALGILLLPTALAWSAAQIGGVLEAPLAARLGEAAGDPGARSGPYWLTVAAVVAFATGAWWTLVGVLVSRFQAAVRRVLGSADWLARSPRGRRLALIGLALVGSSLLGFLL